MHAPGGYSIHGGVLLGESEIQTAPDQSVLLSRPLRPKPHTESNRMELQNHILKCLTSGYIDKKLEKLGTHSFNWCGHSTQKLDMHAY